MNAWRAGGTLHVAPLQQKPAPIALITLAWQVAFGVPAGSRLVFLLLGWAAFTVTKSADLNAARRAGIDPSPWDDRSLWMANPMQHLFMRARYLHQTQSPLVVCCASYVLGVVLLVT
ncbi:MAG TPA: hypothetical protein PKB06_08920 [Actinotalea sp.]|nr:hypothetical protein [Actinotalea sp.]